MAALKIAALALSLLLPGVARAQGVARWRPFVLEASQRYGVPVAWIEKVMSAESAGRTELGGRPIVSRAGAMGLMQLMPATWAAMRAACRLGTDPFDPHDNILAGTAYLRLLYARFGYPGLFGAYNAGPGRYAAHLASGEPLPAETIGYLRTIVGASVGKGGPAPRLLFVEQAASRRASTKTPVGDGLFAIRHDAASDAPAVPLR